MVLLDFPLNDPSNAILVEDGIYLRYPQERDYEHWAGIRAASRSHLQPFEPLWAVDELSMASYRKRLRIYARDIRAGVCRPYFIFRSQDDMLVGGCTLSNIRRRAAMTATLGYWVGRDHIRRGYALSAVKATVRSAFETLKMERIEAACLPDNRASQNLLVKAGFRKEGVARNYLSINGKRRDHVLFGLDPEDFRKIDS
ncbi:GNAT family N-acetyltransferase [Parvularcula flava]|uniref:GNAT family N-acetyltransferase n=1 Tax=Aquisalinus luteolus TaxID=1566827 RepID=A0A8J3A1K3_9PROT|nr:GNAT family protein [Aquisalinus luteolus]NHK26746.1 GNAT family N-acetyltransferase [Aquisalinus luteolus]GGH93288.1 ribosomal-protein-alanine N-acetyltransferase [Aquisalinus luteolus]